jgi:N6-adenosine-specific RNA methylase IME4
MTEYGAILADPPWRFSTYSARGKDRAAERWYDCMSLDDICAMGVGQYAARDCVLFLWVTDPFLREAFRVIDAWGFKYKTVGFYWVKENWVELSATEKRANGWSRDMTARKQVNPIGTGYWTRANPEQCLLATRGSPRRLNADVRKLIIAPRREHSRKPDEVYPRIERLCSGPYLELFARGRRPGWDALGDEVDAGPRAVRRPLQELIEGEEA